MAYVRHVTTVLPPYRRTTAQVHDRAGETGYMLAFGPGFTAQILLLRFG